MGDLVDSGKSASSFEAAMSLVSKTTATVTQTLADNTKYTCSNVSTLNLTLGGIGLSQISCMGTIKFSTQQPSITLTNFNVMDGDDITAAKAKELWEFNVLDGRCIWKNWGEV